MAGHRRLATKRDVGVVQESLIPGAIESARTLTGTPFQFSANPPDGFARRGIQIRIEVQTEVVVLTEIKRGRCLDLEKEVLIIVGHGQSHKVGSTAAVSDGIGGDEIHPFPVLQKTIDTDRLLIAPSDGLAEQSGEEQDSMHSE